MTTQFLSAIALAALLAGCGRGLTSERSAAAAPTTDDDAYVYDIFFQRSIKGHKPTEKPGYDQVVAALSRSKIANAYSFDLNPERSVFLFAECGDPNSWCADPNFRFWSVFQAAAKAAQTDALTLLRNWQTGFKTVDANGAALLSWLPSTLGEPPGDGSDAPSLQLLAIANRLDMAAWDSKTESWSGAEVHFVYGPTGKGGRVPHATLVLEFVLPAKNDKDFQTLAKAWGGLSTSAGAGFATALSDVLVKDTEIPLGGKTGAAIYGVKFRTNREIAASWILTEAKLAVTGNPAEFAFGDLENQFVNNRVDIVDWQGAQDAIAAGKFAFRPTKGLRPNPATYTQEPALGMPPGRCDIGEPARFLLSSGQCTNCHTVETQNDSDHAGHVGFMHVANRAPGEVSLPSNFLSGGAKPHAGGPPQPDLKPALLDLYYPYDATTKPGFDVSVDFQPPATDPQGRRCFPGPPPPARRTFHDIARRTVFLAAVISGGHPVNGRRPDTINQLSSFGVE